MNPLASKYDRFLYELGAAGTVADVQHDTQKVARAIDQIAALSPAAVIEQQAETAADLVDEYVAYVWDGGAKPTWLNQIGL